MVGKLPSYIWDTTAFINSLQGLPPLPSECPLVTLDIFSLYTNIPHQEGICEEFLDLSAPPNCWPLPTYPVHLINECFYFQWEVLSTNTWYGHGHPYGSIICKFVHGQVGMRVLMNPERSTSSVVEVHQWHLRHMNPLRTIPTYLSREPQLSPHYHQVHCELVSQRSCVPRHNSLSGKWPHPNRPAC